eukprot:4916841-Amphidinium_carterae.1
MINTFSDRPCSRINASNVRRVVPFPSMQKPVQEQKTFSWVQRIESGLLFRRKTALSYLQVGCFSSAGLSSISNICPPTLNFTMPVSMDLLC